MHFRNISFNEEETKLIIDQGLLLIKQGYFTAFNLIFSENSLPDNSILIHYLQDDVGQIEHMKKGISSKFGFDERSLLALERPTFYRFDPKYARKPAFKEEYGNAVFLNHDLNEVSINTVISNPNNIIVYNKELDLLVPFNEQIDINEFANFILGLDSEGPEPWIDPAIIIRGDLGTNVKNFITRHYCSMRRDNSEFYAIITDDRIKEGLEKYLIGICEKLHKRTDVSFTKNSVIFLKGDINEELDNYVNRNLPLFKPLA